MGLGLGLGLGVGLVALSLVLSPVLLLRFKTQSDQGWYLANYNSPPLGTLAVCQQLDVPVTVHNLTPLDWGGGPEGSYHLAYHWLDQPDHIFQFEGIRSVMPATLKAGQQATIQAHLRAPARAGSYFLVWDVVEEEVSWFSLKSASYQKQAVEVTASANSNYNLLVTPTGVKAPPPACLMCRPTPNVASFGT